MMVDVIDESWAAIPMQQNTVGFDAHDVSAACSVKANQLPWHGCPDDKPCKQPSGGTKCGPPMCRLASDGAGVELKGCVQCLVMKKDCFQSQDQIWGALPPQCQLHDDGGQTEALKSVTQATFTQYWFTNQVLSAFVVSSADGKLSADRGADAPYWALCLDGLVLQREPITDEVDWVVFALAVLGALYLACGMAYGKIVQGRRRSGGDSGGSSSNPLAWHPHAPLLQQLFGLVKDGVAFTARGGRPSGYVYDPVAEAAAGYSAVGGARQSAAASFAAASKARGEQESAFKSSSTKSSKESKKKNKKMKVNVKERTGKNEGVDGKRAAAVATDADFAPLAGALLLAERRDTSVHSSQQAVKVVATGFS